MHQEPLNERKSCQSVNPDYFDFSNSAEGVIKLTTALGKSPASDVVRLCFVVRVAVLCGVCLCDVRTTERQLDVFDCSCPGSEREAPFGVT